jgi:membrane-associated phospholipid phosphatase
VRSREALLGVVLSLLVASTAHAEPSEPAVEWKREWRPIETWEVVLTSSMSVGILGIVALTHEREPAWKDPVLLDDTVRDYARAETADGRKRAQIVGDATYYAALAYPLLVDAFAVTWLGHRKPDVAAKIALIDLEALSVTGFLSFLSNALIRRERPYARACRGPDDPVFPDCTRGGQSESFFSGHTGIAATTAGLTCAHHANLPLYGGGAPDAFACVSTVAGALVTGYARLVADKHYLVDVLAGMIIGFPVGFGFATYHYRTGKSPSTAGLRRSVHLLPMVSGDVAGLALGGLL